MSLNLTTGSVSQASVADAIKEYYENGQPPEDLTEKDNPGWGMLSKKVWAGGRPWKIAAKYANTSGRAPTLSGAQTNVGSFKPMAFEITRVRDYAVARLDGETILETQSDAASFFDALTTEIDSSFMVIANRMAEELYNDGLGAIDTLDSTTPFSGETFTLANPTKVRHFEVGFYIDFWDASAAAVKTSTTASQGKITAINRSTGVITLGDLTQNIDHADSYNFTPVAADSVGIRGDLVDGGAALSVTKLSGLEGWNPATVTSTAFFSVDRTVDQELLAGGRYNGDTDGETYEETFISACAYAQRYGGRFEYIMMNPESFAEFEKELGSKRTYLDVSSAKGVDVGYRAIAITAPWGTVKVMADGNCPKGVHRGVDWSKLVLRTLGQAGPAILDLDGLQKVRLSTEDGYELRIGYYGNLGCINPKSLMRIIKT